MAGAAAEPRPQTFHFPTDTLSESSKQQHKLKTQRENPETLFKDCSVIKGKTTTTNLLFYTQDTDVWHAAICSHYKYVTKRGICKGRQIYIFEDSERESDNRFLTINLYQNGTVMIQGSEAALTQFEKTFPSLKTQCKNERASDPSLALPPEEHSAQREPQPLHSHTPTVEDTPPSTSTAPFPSPRLLSTVTQLRDSLSMMEVELIGLKEQMQTHISTNSGSEPLKDQINQTKHQLKVAVQDLRKEVHGLLNDREVLRKELAEYKDSAQKEFADLKLELNQELLSLRQEIQLRDTVIESLKEQLKSQSSPMNNAHTKDAQLTQSSSDTAPNPTKPDDTQTLPTTQREHTEPIPETATAPQNHQENKTHTTPNRDPRASRPSASHTDAEVAILIDSNGKFLQEEKLFPGRKTTKIWCPRTRDAHQILSGNILDKPTCIIIHTGTNDLRAEQERVGGLVCSVAQRAAENFPSAKIIVSTLLPRKDFHPATIQKVNAEISRGCALIPNVHLAHHSNIGPHHLYDHVHLNRNTVIEFAKTLKDVALGRQRHVGPKPMYRGEHAAMQRFHTTTRSPPTRKPPQRPPPGLQRYQLNLPHSSQHVPPARPAPRPSPHEAKPHHSPVSSAHQNQPESRATEALLPQNHNPQQQRSYADALRGTNSNKDMGEIKQLLQYICNRLV